MSKLKSALLLNVALSPIFVSAARGIEVVHAEVVQPNVVQPVKAGQNVDEAATPNHSSRANHQAHKGKIIAFDDNNFTKKFEESSFFKKSKSKLGIDNVTIKDDAKWATDTANYIGQMIAARVESLKNRPDLKAALNLRGVIGSFISMLCDWLLPTKVDENLEKIKELNERLTALGTNMTESSAAVGEKVDQAAIDEKMTAFKNTLVGCKTTYTSFDSDLQAKGISIKDLIQNPDQEKAKKCADAYKELYSSPDFGVDEVNGTVDEKSENTENFTKLCQFGTAIASANRYNNDIFQLFSDYESLKEYFNTSTFAARDTFEELTMRVYSACLDQMQTAILFDYYRVEGQIKYITQNKDTEADDFDDKFPLTSSLLDKLKLAARNDLYRLGFDTVTAGHVSYEIDDYINNKWVLASDPTNTKVKNLYNTLASNSKAVNYAFANSVENKPVKTFVRFNPKYDGYVKQDAQYQKYLFDLQDEINGLEYQIVNLIHERAESEKEFQEYLHTISQQANFNSQDIAKLQADHLAAIKEINANISKKQNDVKEKKIT